MCLQPLAVGLLSAQETEVIEGAPGVAQNKITVNFRALERWEAHFKARVGPIDRPQRAAPFRNIYKNETGDGPSAARQNSLQTISPEPGSSSASQAAVNVVAGPSPPPSITFPALEDNNTTIPPDTMGAVGLNHVMTTLNSQVRIQDRQGAILSTVDLATFWAPLGNADPFDPKVVYDPYEHRFIFTAFGGAPLFFGTNVFNLFSSSILLAVSETSDPTGNWFLYRVFVDQFANNWADYPSIGFNKDRIVVSANMFSADFFSTFTGVQIYVFDKANVYTNGLGNHTLLHLPTDFFGLVRAFTVVPAVTYDRDLEEMYLMDIFNFGNNTVNSTLRISTISGDIGREILRLGTSFTTNFVNWAPTDVGFLQGFAPQLGSFALIENNDARIQNVVYRNGSLWCTHTVFLPAGVPTRSAVQWWQIAPTPTNAITHQFGRIEDINAVNFYAFPSIAVNRCSDVMIGYSSFSPNQFASAAYSFRFGSDPTNGMRTAALLKQGEGPYLKTFLTGRNRWGDYSATVVDPVNDLDMWTIQEYAETPVGTGTIDGEGRWGTWWGQVDVASLAQCGQIEFALANYSVSENPPLGIAVITVTNLTGTPGTVQFTTSNGSGEAGRDYVTSSGTLTFVAGQTFTNFTVTILDDGVLSSNRTVNLSLFNATGAAALGGLTNAVLTIVDDEFVPLPNIAGEFNFSTYYRTNIDFMSILDIFFGPSFFVTEFQGLNIFPCGNEPREIFLPNRTALGSIITVTRTGGTTGRVMVDWATAEGGTAIPFRDYTPTNGTFTFDDFQMSTNILVQTRSDAVQNGHKYIRLVLSNPRPAPEEEAERPGLLRPTLGPGSSSQIVIIENGYGIYLAGIFFGVPIGGIPGGILTSNYLPAFSFERLNYRVDEYPGNNATDISGGVRQINIDVIAQVAGTVRVRTSDPRARLILLNPYTEPGSDLAEAYGDREDPDPFSGSRTHPNPVFTDSTLPDIVNFTDYFSFNSGFSSTDLTFTDTVCHRRVLMLITNDATVEFNEDIVVFLEPLVGQPPVDPWAEQTTVTIMYHDQPAGAVDREWNPDNVAMPGRDPDFDRVPGANDTVYAVAVQPDGKTLLAGDFTSVNGWPRRRIGRMTVDGGNDLTFDPGDGADQAITGLSLVSTNGGTNFGKILICGNFQSFNGFLHNGITRLLPNGQVDTSFNPGNGANGPVWGIAQQADGKIIVVGDFTQFNSVDRVRVARLHPDGGLDLTFNANGGPDFAVYSVAVVPSLFGPEKIVLAGDFFSVNGQPHFRIAQLLNDGSLDPGFSAGAGADRSVYSVLVQPNGRILVAGAFSDINDTPRVGIARLFGDGTLDPSFDPAYGANDSVYTMTLQPDGKILIGGVFTEYNRTRRMGLARLRDNATLDTSFLDTAYNQYAGFTHPFSFLPPNFVNSIALQADGNIMVGGSFTNVGGNPAARHALRNSHTVFTRADKRNRFNIARLIGGFTHGTGNAEFDADDYFVDENAGIASIRLNRTDGRLGTLLGRGITEDRFATRNVDYTQSTNSNAWIQQYRDVPTPYSVGQVGAVYFRIPILDDLLEEGDELLDLRFLRAEGTLNLGGEIMALGGALGRSFSTLGLIDNDFPKGEFNFLLGNYVTNEFTTNIVHAIITVIRTNGSHGGVSVQYFTRNSTNTPIATAGLDYDAVNSPVRLDFQPGQTTNFFSIRIRNDGDVEFDENIELVLTNATGGARLPGGKRTSVATSTLTIVDDDFPYGRLNFSVNTFTNNESEAFAAIKITRTGGNLGTVSAQYRMTDGTAASPADYQSGSGTLTWNNGDSVDKFIQIPLVADGQVEGPQNFRIHLFDPRVGGGFDARLLGNRTNSLVMIADGDAYGTVAFSQPFLHADENASMVSVTVVRTAGSSETLSVNYSATADSAVPGLDFTPVSGTLVFHPGQTSTNFVVALLDDSDSDGNKTVRLQLSDPAPAGALLGLLNVVSLTLVDNESFANPPGENDRSFQQAGGANGPVFAVGLYLTNGIFDGRLMIAGDFTNVNNVARQSVARLHSDSSLDTTFDVGVGANAAVRAMVVQPDGKVILGGDFTQVTGTNRNGIARFNIEGTLDRFFNPGAAADGPVYALALQTDEKVLVGGAFSRFNNEARPRLVRLNTNAIVDTTFSAGAGPDGTIFALAVQPDGKVLVGGEFTQFSGVPRRGLARLNRNGSVDLSFNIGSGFNAAVRAIALQPDGRIVVGGSFTSINGVPRNFLARVDAFGNVDNGFLTGVSGGDNSVHALGLQVDGRIVVAGDFTRFNDVTRNRLTRLNSDGSTDPTINFGSGANSFIASVAIQPDRKIVIGGGFTAFDGEPRRRFARLYGGSIAGNGSLEFAAQPFLTDEFATNALVIVRRRGGTTGAVGVDFSTLDLSALAGRDYVPTNLTVAFPQGEALRNVFVRILDNSSPNVDRELGLSLNNFTGGATFGSRPTSTLVIVNDEALVSFSVTNFVTSEGNPSGQATISVVRTLGTNTPFSVNFAVGGGTATPSVDYAITNGTLTFSSGDLLKNFHVPIFDDGLVEGPEYLSLLLQGPTAKAFLGTNTGTLTILDNDFAPGQILLSSTNYVVDESGHSAEITILRTNGRTGTITFDITTVDGTATGDLDYIRTNATIAFADGELLKTIRVPILIDFISEPSETFNVLLSRPTGGASIVSPSSAVVTILNNDRPYGTFIFATNTIAWPENASSVPLTIYRIDGSVSTVTVNLATTGASATPGADYVTVNTTLTFPPGVTNMTVPIPLLDDTLQEGSEMFTAALSGATSGAGLGNPRVCAIQIIDNDSPILIAAGATLIAESNPNGIIDSNEQVTLRLGIRNIGFTNTVNLLATVQPGGGAVNPNPRTASYGVVQANGPTNFQNFVLTANVTNNGLLTVTLALTNSGLSLGTISYQFRVGSTTYNFANTNLITINDNTIASPYPSTILVSDIVGSITKVTATLSNINHTFPDDMDFLLVSPSGDAVILMSDAGGGNALVNVSIRYTDSAPSAPPDAGQLFSGDCLPINHANPNENPADGFEPPAPSPYLTNNTAYWPTSMSFFNGKNPNGTWSLYVVDDAGGDHGTIAGGWSLSITTATPVNEEPPSIQYISTSIDGRYRLAVRGQPGLRYTLHASHDLRTYTPARTFIMPNGGVYYYEEFVAENCKFFRASKNP